MSGFGPLNRNARTEDLEDPLKVERELTVFTHTKRADDIHHIFIDLWSKSLGERSASWAFHFHPRHKFIRGGSRHNSSNAERSRDFHLTLQDRDGGRLTQIIYDWSDPAELLTEPTIVTLLTANDFAPFRHGVVSGGSGTFFEKAYHQVKDRGADWSDIMLMFDSPGGPRNELRIDTRRAWSVMAESTITEAPKSTAASESTIPGWGAWA